MNEPALRLEGIEKAFGPVRALSGVTLEVAAGEVHVLVGENGAGKSTLMKVLSGALRPDAGKIFLGGEEVRLRGAKAGRAAGVSMIYQELMLAPHLTVEENVTLGGEATRGCGFVRCQKVRVAEALRELGHEDISPGAKVGSLPVGKRQVVEIARALVSEAKVVIMDEPTSSLSDEDKVALFRVVGALKERGLAVIYISHFLDEVKAIGDRFTVLRDGETVAAGEVADVTIGGLAELMVGRALTEFFPEKVKMMIGSAPLMRAVNVRGVRLPCGVSFGIEAGEVMGIYGLVGSGRTELARCLVGLDKVVSGRVEMISGIDYLSEDRQGEGLAQSMSVAANVTLSALEKDANRGWIRLRAERKRAQRKVDELGVKCRGIRDAVSTLSGGNQQKVAVARLMNRGAEVLILDEPTRGIDVGSKHQIYVLIRQLASLGRGLLVISSYLPELVGVCDTLAVMHRGVLSAKRDVENWVEGEIMHWATTGRSTDGGKGEAA